MQNTAVVQEAYAAFGRGDIPALLNCLDSDIIWKPLVGAGAHVPLAGVRRGKAAVEEFFRLLGELQVFEQFEPKEFVEQGNKVIALGHYIGVPKMTGVRFESDWAMVFTFKSGKIVEFQEFADSAALNAAWEGVAV